MSGSDGSVMRSEGEVWEGMEVGVDERAYIVDWGEDEYYCCWWSYAFVRWVGEVRDVTNGCAGKKSAGGSVDSGFTAHEIHFLILSLSS